jgi:hypothetical protein
VLGVPAFMLVMVAFGWRLPDWVMTGLVAGFVGGFVYLVWTMSRTGRDDGPYDDGAVV